MYIYSKQLIERISNERHFIKTNVEKVLRLYDILEYINTDKDLKTKFALKGGTAINLLISSVPRLSVDIDLDVAQNIKKDELVNLRNVFKRELLRFIDENNYKISDKCKATYALDSYVLTYKTAFNSTDNIKVEINYLNRAHVLPLEVINVNTIANKKIDILMVNQCEIYASKLVALYNRFAARDLFDIYLMINNKIISNIESFKKCFIFYSLISGDRDILEINSNDIKSISYLEIKKYLLPVLNSETLFDCEEAIKVVSNFMDEILNFDRLQILFINNF